MIGLGVGIDYALFIVTRHKLQLGEGMEVRESVARATATAGGAVVFAGFTVVIALCSLAFAGIPLVSTLGFTAAIAVVVAVCAAATLLPAMLGALGPHIESLRVPGTKSGAEGAEPHGWRRWARGVAGRPWRSALAALAVLIVLALPIFQLELGQNDLSALPKSTTARQNYDSLTKGFGPGVNGPLLIAAKYQDPEERQRSLPALVKAVDAGPRRRRRLRTDPWTRRAPSPFHGDLRLGALGRLRPSAWSKTCATKRSRRRSGGTDGAAYVGGQTAGYIDLATKIAEKLPLMIAIVVGLSFIVLLLAFRSLLVPVKAAAMNLLSVAAAYGVVTGGLPARLGLLADRA
jgi:RND superfamily putative drug exporter